MSLEPRTVPEEPTAPAAELAVQNGGQPTRKVSAASNAGGSFAAVLAGVMAGYGGPAIQEMLGEYGTTHPMTTQLIIAAVAAVAAFLVTKYGGQAAAYNVLDKPNVALVRADKA